MSSGRWDCCLIQNRKMGIVEGKALCKGHGRVGHSRQASSCGANIYLGDRDKPVSTGTHQRGASTSNSGGGITHPRMTLAA